MQLAVNRLLLEIGDVQLKTLIVELDELGRSRWRSAGQKELERLLETLGRPSLAAPRLVRSASGDATASVADLLKMVVQKRRRRGISRPTDEQGCS